MRVVYSSTRPRYTDTYKIALDKWKQRVNDGAVADNGEGGVTTFSNPNPDPYDGKLKTVQKILNTLP